MSVHVAEFAPSEVTRHFTGSDQSEDRQALSAWLLCFLCEHKGNCWGEFTWGELANYLTHGTPDLATDYVQRVQGFQSKETARALQCMLNEGYLTYREDGKKGYLAAGEKLLGFYAGYLK
jgi:hypothetical protein